MFVIYCLNLYNEFMTPQEKIQKINEIYEKANERLELLQKKRKGILKTEISQTEAQEIEKLRALLLESAHNQK